MGYVSSILTSTIPYVLLSVVVYTVVRFFIYASVKKNYHLSGSCCTHLLLHI